MSKGQDPGEAQHAKFVQPPTCIRTSAIRQAYKVSVTGDALVRGTEVPIFCPERRIWQPYKEAGSLSGAHLCDVAERLLSLVKPTVYPFTLSFPCRLQ